MVVSSGCISKALTIVWKTQKAYEKTPRYSSKFTLMGETWNLRMESDAGAAQWYDFNCGRITNGCYTVCLMKGEVVPKPLPFSVTTYIETYASQDGCPSRGLITKYDASKSSSIWSYNKKFVEGQIAGFRDCTELTVVCMFRDIESSTCRIENETIEVTTQTDFDRPLGMKNLHGDKVSSDEREEGASCLSSNLDSLSRDLSKLLKDKVLSDVNLRCADRTVAAHKAVLAARSEVFSAMFQSKMLESETGMVDIADVDVQVIELFLKYVYSGKLSDISDEALPSLYAAGDKYAVSGLKKACSERLISNLTQENCFDILSLADVHSDQDFKNAILDFILNHVEILKSQKWTKFNTENPTLSIEVFQTVFQKKFFT